MASEPTAGSADAADPSGTVALVSARPMFLRTFAKLLVTLRPTLTVRPCPPIAHVPIEDASALILLDMAGLVGEAVGERVAEWRAVDPARRLVPVLDDAHDASVDAAMAAGAVGVMVKATPPGVIAEWLDALLGGAVVRPAPLVNPVPEALNDALRERLSEQQQRLLALTLGGHSVAAVARALGISSASVVAETRRVMALVRGRAPDT